jgi:hypothetical protein
VVIKGVQSFVDRVKENSLQLSASFALPPEVPAEQPSDERSIILTQQVEWLTYVSERIASKAPAIERVEGGPKRSEPSGAHKAKKSLEGKEN